MKIQKHTFSDEELKKFTLDFHNMHINTEPLYNLIIACIKHGNNPIIDYYKKEYLSNHIYHNYCSASSIVTSSFLKTSFGFHHFTFLSNFKHNNYILSYGSLKLLVSSTTKELISNDIHLLNIYDNPTVIKEIIIFSLKFQQLLTLYGISDKVPPKFEHFFQRMINQVDIRKIITADYDKELENF